MELNREFSEKAKKDFLLIEKAKSTGDEKAFAELMSRYKKPVYHMILKMIRNVDDAEDLTIEAFAKAFKNLQKFNPEFTFSTWLFRIATNNCIDFMRKKKLATTSISGTYKDDAGENVDMEFKDSGLNPMEEAIKAQKVALVQSIVTKLPPKYQTLVKLRYFEELSYEEIAVELDAPLGTVKAQLHRARELLYDLVKNRKDSM
ncbi:MAG TPA: sigma-70 family RNA polymerase sigma factor [Cytophagaceae bacterium]|jgi:RNA polymerase sigma factor (sigma-70 family)|nr:sigma-70 family RNA polymerase sigma factor [Cytophagaceae bacterium]